ncbi:hypothetical protein [Caldimonas tepidiphila]|uniref:hypothetical protein n=1 Tax=Caldimonas tepidiphila TaxID=2315841 RepID=UPI000E5A8F49|nr:hypothetical protein [Caldimonas tepidiphila]
MTLDAFQQALDAFRVGTIDTAAFCRRLRAEAVPPQLPPRYGEVLANLLERLESAALFGGESCSFSQADLVAGLQGWIDKARERLADS